MAIASAFGILNRPFSITAHHVGFAEAVVHIRLLWERFNVKLQHLNGLGSLPSQERITESVDERPARIEIRIDNTLESVELRNHSFGAFCRKRLF